MKEYIPLLENVIPLFEYKIAPNILHSQDDRGNTVHFTVSGVKYELLVFREIYGDLSVFLDVREISFGVLNKKDSFETKKDLYHLNSVLHTIKKMMKYYAEQDSIDYYVFAGEKRKSEKNNRTNSIRAMAYQRLAKGYQKMITDEEIIISVDSISDNVTHWGEIISKVLKDLNLDYYYKNGMGKLFGKLSDDFKTQNGNSYITFHLKDNILAYVNISDDGNKAMVNINKDGKSIINNEYTDPYYISLDIRNAVSGKTSKEMEMEQAEYMEMEKEMSY